MPAAFDLEKKGYKALMWGPDVTGLPFINGITTTLDKIKNRPEEVQKVVRAILKAIKFIREGREQTVALMMQWMRINQELAEKSYDVSLRGFSLTGDPDPEAMKPLFEQAKKDAGVADDIPVSRVVEFSLLKAVQKELRLPR